jgi:AraC-like DNA-binding protein
MLPSLDVHYAHDAHVPTLESCLVRGSTHAFPNHFHESLYAVGVMEAGGSYCLGPGREDSFVAPGELALINPGQVHSGVPRPGVANTYRMVYLGVEPMRVLACEVAERDVAAPEFDRLILPDRHAWGLLRCLSRLVLEPGAAPLETEALAAAAISGLLEEHARVGRAARAGQEEGAVRRAKEFLDADLAEKASLEQAARAAGLSRYHFLRVFKAATGLSPHQYRTQRRIEAARHLLKQGRPIAEVAQDTGFTDQAHFTRTFRRLTGVTPRRFLAP